MTTTPSKSPSASSLLSLVVVCAISALFGLSTRARAEPGVSWPVGSVAFDSSEEAPPHPIPERARPPGARPGDGGPSPVIFPAQSLPLRFNHRKHVKDLGMTCTTCHDAPRSRSSADNLLPPATRCDGCHGSDHGDNEVRNHGGERIGECAFCHVDYRPGEPVRRVSIPRPYLRFDHALHLGRGMSCEKCHGDVGETVLATRDQLPRMKGCLTCHQKATTRKGEASGACATCHLTDKGGVLKTSLATGKLLPPAWLHDSEHGPDWIERHKAVAGDESRFCANCHQERFCTACHDGRVRPRRVHPNDWLNQHDVAARQNSPSCTSCHRQQSFCLTCHQRAGVTLSGPYGNLAQRGRFHPPKSVWTDGARTRSHHAWEAERNLNACVSCHTERDCATCHATAGVGGRGTTTGPRSSPGRGTNPHPSDFLGRCGTALRANARPCLVCHDLGDPNLSRCR
jgi:hypothetical protein